ncbi:MAG TPA: hypothetical protein VH590_15090, partial [Ktedonobacterales bacterium]
AVVQQETPPASEDFEQLNPRIFEEQRERPWSAILAEDEQVYDALIDCTQQLSEEDLTSFHRFDWIPNQEPLYSIFMGNWYEHTQQHLAQYYLDRNNLPRATHIYETWANRIAQADAPEALKGTVLYNLACFYATHAQLEKAAATLSQALTLAPFLKEWSLADPDLIALRPADQPA